MATKLYILRGIGSGFMIQYGVFSAPPSDALIAKLTEMEEARHNLDKVLEDNPGHDHPFTIRVDEIACDRDILGEFKESAEKAANIDRLRAELLAAEGGPGKLRAGLEGAQVSGVGHVG